MIFYHGTTQENWEEIQKEGQLYGHTRIVSNDRKTVLEDYRITYLTPMIEEASCYGNVILQVNYDPYKEGAVNNYGEGCWQFRVYEPIPLSDVKEVRHSKYNMNTKAIVKLTKYGAEILNKHIEEIKSKCQTYQFEPYEEGYLFSSQLWDIMQIFGNSLTPGEDVPFKDNEITIIQS